MFTLDLNGKTRVTETANWYDGICAHYGHYGMWTMVNVNPMTRMAVISDSASYMGDGSDCRWAIRWD